MWTKSACVVLAWTVLIILVAVSNKGSVHRAQANISTASSTEITLISMQSRVTASVAAASPAARYVVQPGDTLTGIATALAVRGGWPALYAANRPLIGPDPNIILPGTVLVVPGVKTPVHYTVAAGDTLSGIAAALEVPGGWPALYAANRRVIGPDPNLIRTGTVLAIPRPAASAPGASSPGRRVHTAPPASRHRPVGRHRPVSRHRPVPRATGAPAAAGMPSWLKIVLVAAGLLIAAAFLAEAVLGAGRRRRRAGARRAWLAPGQAGQEPGSARQPRVVLVDHDRLVVTCSMGDGTVYVLRPPGTDPKAIMRVARLVLPEGHYRELAGELGLPASWPFVLADYDRLVVTWSTEDGTVYVLRPPGTDPETIMMAARLVLPEDPYEELADQLGVPASWPAG